MKKIFFIAAFTIVITRQCDAQNLFLNGSFEIGNTTTHCPNSIPNTEGDFDCVQNWHSFGTHSGTPDWWQGPYPSVTAAYNTADPYTIPHSGSGTFMAGIFDEEGIYYDFGTSGLNTSIYHLKFWMRDNPDNAAYSTDGVKVYLTTLAPTNLSCSSIAGGNVLLLHTAYHTSNYTWQEVNFEFDVFNDVIPYRYLVVTGLRDGNCDRYMYLDDFSITENCCGNYILYQSFNNLPVNTERSDYIRAGENVGAAHVGIGPVVVQNNQYVKFKAGNYIDLQPGFSIEPGGVYIGEIGNCGEDIDPNSTFDIDLNYANQCVILTCDQTYGEPTTNCFGTNAAFYSKGGGYYRVQIFNGWDVKIYDKIEPINSLITMYWNGSGTFTSDLSEIAVVQLSIYNCEEMILETYSITYEYDDNCRPWYKKEFEVSSYLSDEKMTGIMVYPNPVNDIITVTDDSPQPQTDFTYLIYDTNSSIVGTGYTVNSKVDFSSLSQGVYYLRLVDKQQMSKSFKIVKL